MPNRETTRTEDIAADLFFFFTGQDARCNGSRSDTHPLAESEFGSIADLIWGPSLYRNLTAVSLPSLPVPAAEQHLLSGGDKQRGGGGGAVKELSASLLSICALDGLK